MDIDKERGIAKFDPWEQRALGCGPEEPVESIRLERLAERRSSLNAQAEVLRGATPMGDMARWVAGSLREIDTNIERLENIGMQVLGHELSRRYPEPGNEG